jgi:sugar phosphate permease
MIRRGVILGGEEGDRAGGSSPADARKLETPADRSTPKVWAGLPPHRRLSPAWALLLISTAVLLAMSPWFTAVAAGDWLEARFALDPGQRGWLTTTVQLGFVGGTLLAAYLNLADLVPTGRYFAVSALLAAGANALLPLASGWGGLLLLRFLTGFFLAGVYPPAMKMAATWFRARRGLAIGAVVGALTIGKALPFLLRALEEVHTTPGVVTGSSLAGGFGAMLVLIAYRDGPYPFPKRPFQRDLILELVRHRATRWATFGYLGHMWELYAMWGTVHLFLGAHLSGRFLADPEGAAAIWAFWIIAAGSVGALAAGVLADGTGREKVAGGAMFLSALVALSVGWMVDAPSGIVIPLLLLWGVVVVADSAQFSALVTEVSPAHAAGTALTLQTSLGFLLTSVTLTGVPILAERSGWGPAYTLLALGPILGGLAMIRLARLRGTSAPSEPAPPA